MANGREMRLPDFIRVLIIFCGATAAAFAPLLKVFPYLNGRGFSNPATLDDLSITANMCLALAILMLMPAIMTLVVVAPLAGNFLRVPSIGFCALVGLGCLKDLRQPVKVYGYLCFVAAAVGLLLGAQSDTRWKKLALRIWVLMLLGFIASYPHLGVKPIVALPLTKFGPTRLQGALLGLDLYVGIACWASCVIFKKAFWIRTDADPVLTLSDDQHERWFVMFPGAAFFMAVICGFSVAVMMVNHDSLHLWNVSAWTIFWVSLIGHCAVGAALLLALFDERIVQAPKKAKKQLLRQKKVT